MAQPRYRVLQECFIAPYRLAKDSIIEGDQFEAAGHLEPLNDEAKAKMEAWYNKTYTHTVDGKVITEQPNKGKRPWSAGGEVLSPAEVTLVSNPPMAPTEQSVQAGLDRPLQPDLIPTDPGYTPPRPSVGKAESTEGPISATDEPPVDDSKSTDGNMTIVKAVAPPSKELPK